MRERRGLPRGSAVTAITGCGCGKVVDGFALSAGGVMARRTSTGLQAAVGKRRRCPCLVLMTRIALLQGRNMVAVLGRTRKTAARLMTGIAIFGGSLKYASLMATLAARDSVRAC